MDGQQQSYNRPLVVESDMEDWNNPNFNFLDSNPTADTLFDTSAFLNDAANSPSPSGFARYSSPAKPAQRIDSKIHHAPSTLKPRSITSSASVETSSQGSASESSSRRRRKASTSSSPGALFNQTDGFQAQQSKQPLKKEADAGDTYGLEDFTMSGNNDGTSRFNGFDLMDMDFPNSYQDTGASPPSFINPRMVSMESPTDAFGNITKMQQMATNTTHNQFLFESRDPSPLTNAQAFSHQASPSNFLGQPSPTSSGGDTSNDVLMLKNGSTSQRRWKQNVMNDSSPDAGYGATPPPHQRLGRQHAGPKLYVEKCATKSRVETQISIHVILTQLPQGITRVHLPPETISKPKYMASDRNKRADTLEMSIRIVCATALMDKELGAYITAKCRNEDVPEPPRRKNRRSSSVVLDSVEGEESKEATDDDDPEKPINGGEIKICTNCINRERKRAARKKTKKNCDQEELWNSFEDKRIVVFNTNEYQEWKSAAQRELDGEAGNPPYPDNSAMITLPMRIACYCRHHQEKVGFSVVFTLFDNQGNFVTQAWTRPILITDDHKTHITPQQMPGYMGHMLDFPAPEHFGGFNGLDSQNMGMDVAQSMAGGAMARHRPYASTSDLQAMQQGFHGRQPQPGAFQNLVNNGAFSASLPRNRQNPIPKSTSTTNVPGKVSRQASPSGQGGSNKRRKGSGSGMYGMLPSSLAMTPLDQGTATAMPSTSMSASNMNPPFSPSSVQSGYSNTSVPKPLTIPAANPFNTGPVTPGSTSGYITTPGHRESFDLSSQAFYSAPTSAHPSRAPSPVAISRPPLSMQHSPPQAMLNQPVSFLDANNVPRNPHSVPTFIMNVVPQEGPTAGGIDVTIVGRNLPEIFDVKFGDALAPTKYHTQDVIICTLPAYPTPSTVPVSIHTRGGGLLIAQQMFTYIDNDENQVMRLALQILASKATGNANNWREFAGSVLGRMPNQRQWNGNGASGYSGGNGNYRQQASMNNAAGQTSGQLEETLLRILDLIDLDTSPHEVDYNMHLSNGATLLSLCSGLGFTRVVAGLLARGAEPDTRDIHGLTPLMMAARKGYVGIVHRLILRGADPTMRNLRGATAADMAPTEEVLQALQRVRHHHRSMSGGGASLVSIRSRPGSSVSLHSLWGPPSPYNTSPETSEDENSDDDSQDTPPALASVSSPTLMAPSRRGSLSELTAGIPSPTLLSPSEPTARVPTPAMALWRDQLAAQIQAFQQTVHYNFQNLQLPALPALPDVQDSAMMRKISSLVPQRTNSAAEPSWRDLFSNQNSPPAYHEIYPDQQDQMMDMKKTGLLNAAAANAVLDGASYAHSAFQRQPPTALGKVRASGTSSSTSSLGELKFGRKSAISSEQQDKLRRVHAAKLKGLGVDKKLWFVWIPLLLIFLPLLFKNRLPEGSFFWKQDTIQRPVNGRVVEV